jgi:hypothetical protein
MSLPIEDTLVNIIVNITGVWFFKAPMGAITHPRASSLTGLGGSIIIRFYKKVGLALQQFWLKTVT